MKMTLENMPNFDGSKRIRKKNSQGCDSGQQPPLQWDSKSMHYRRFSNVHDLWNATLTLKVAEQCMHLTAKQQYNGTHGAMGHIEMQIL
jgi:hypothetical protein